MHQKHFYSCCEKLTELLDVSNNLKSPVFVQKSHPVLLPHALPCMKSDFVLKSPPGVSGVA